MRSVSRSLALGSSSSASEPRISTTHARMSSIESDISASGATSSKLVVRRAAPAGGHTPQRPPGRAHVRRRCRVGGRAARSPRFLRRSLVAVRGPGCLPADRGSPARAGQRRRLTPPRYGEPAHRRPRKHSGRRTTPRCPPADRTPPDPPCPACAQGTTRCRHFVTCARWQGSAAADRKSTRLHSSHAWSSYAVFCLKKKKSPDHASQQNDQQELLPYRPVLPRNC